MAIMEEYTHVQGLQHLLRSVAEKLHGDVDGLSKELLLRSADRLDKLEWVAGVAVRIVDNAPTKGDGAVRVLVDRRLVIELMRALQGAGERVKTLHV